MTASAAISKRNSTTLIQSCFQVWGASMFLAICAQAEFALPFTPVSITFQTFAMLLVGGILGSKKGAASVLLYLAQAAVGLPVLAGGYGGLFAFVGPRAGYIVGFVFQAYLMGYLVERMKTLTSGGLLFAAGASCAFQLSIGVIWLSTFVGWGNVLMMGLIPFVPGEIIKCLAISSFMMKRYKETGDAPSRI